jgi:hypothetical protein
MNEQGPVLIMDGKGAYPSNLDRAIEEQRRYYMAKTVFVFGSNEAGIHGAGAAKDAYKNHGAQWGKSYGHYGDSFAIPTKDEDIQTLSLYEIGEYVKGFVRYAKGHHRLKFRVTRIGCGLAGYEDKDIAPLFNFAPINCEFDEAWKPWLGNAYTYWGHVA